jgi:predicted ester cyclase
MSPDELKARSRRLVEEVFNQGDLAVVDELVAPTFALHDLTSSPAPRGADEFREYVSRLRRAFPDINGYVEDVIADGDRVVQRISVTGTHLGVYEGCAPTGRRVAYDVIEIDRYGADGLIAEAWCLEDQYGLFQQIGAIAPTRIQTGV